jgi:Ca2+-binding EF-hand superfamily protein
MMLIALFLLADEPAPNCRTRAGCDAAVRAVISGSDSDGDGRLSRSEWTRMGEKALAPHRNEMVPADMARMRRDIADDFRGEDGDGDGYLTREEMLKVRMAAFPCFDANADGTLSGEEQSAGIDTCRPGDGSLR